jgi:hypothetical protein
MYVHALHRKLSYRKNSLELPDLFRRRCRTHYVLGPPPLKVARPCEEIGLEVWDYRKCIRMTPGRVRAVYIRLWINMYPRAPGAIYGSGNTSFTWWAWHTLPCVSRGILWACAGEPCLFVVKYVMNIFGPDCNWKSDSLYLWHIWK